MDEQASDAEQRKRFMDAASCKLGFCLPPKVQEALKKRTDLSPKDFIRAVIEAEGIELIHLDSYENFEPLMSLYRKHVSD